MFYANQQTYLWLTKNWWHGHCDRWWRWHSQHVNHIPRSDSLLSRLEQVLRCFVLLYNGGRKRVGRAHLTIHTEQWYRMGAEQTLTIIIAANSIAISIIYTWRTVCSLPCVVGFSMSVMMGAYTHNYSFVQKTGCLHKNGWGFTVDLLARMLDYLLIFMYCNPFVVSFHAGWAPLHLSYNFVDKKYELGPGQSLWRSHKHRRHLQFSKVVVFFSRVNSDVQKNGHVWSHPNANP